MTITASMVKELREITGAGMMDCKKALTETNGDMDKAMELLREKGLAAAAKKAGRIAAEGLVMDAISQEGKIGALVEVNSETDFVAKNEDFRSYVTAVAKQATETKATSIEEFLAEPWNENTSQTVQDVLAEKVGVIGENLSIRRFVKFEATQGTIVSYIHGGGRIGVLIELETEIVNDAVIEAGKNLAMQVAAVNPQYVSRDEISEEYIEKERNFLTQQALNEGKPANIVEKMVIGRLNKSLQEVCLVDQAYVKDGDLTVQKYLDGVSKEVGSRVTIKRFVRFETGEGLEKREENFAEEVAKQMQG